MKNLVGMLDVTHNDPYLVRDCDKDAFDYVIDIGANTGQFSLFTRLLFPLAAIHSYEPCSITYNLLCENLSGFERINIVNKALGNGEPFYFKPSGGRSQTCTGNMFKPYDTSGYKIDSITLDNIFKDIDTTKNVLLKIDCEGGEIYIMDDKYNDILQSCKQAVIEIHFNPISKPEEKFSNFRDLPDWEVYNDWIHGVFENTHDIIYHYSNKHKGVGHYVMKIKK